jgi:hypothetical protein
MQTQNGNERISVRRVWWVSFMERFLVLRRGAIPPGDGSVITSFVPIWREAEMTILKSVKSYSYAGYDIILMG